MSERNGNTILISILAVAAIFLGVSYLVPVIVEMEETQRAADARRAAELQAVQEPVDETLDKALEPLEDAVDEAHEQMHGLLEDSRERELEDLRLKAEWYQARAHRAEAALAEKAAEPQVVSDELTDGWTPPCPDGCDLGGASHKVPQGVLIPWYDTGYSVAHDELRVNRNRAGVGRSQRTSHCIELVRLPQRHPTKRQVSTQDAQGSGSIEASGVLADTGYTPNQELLLAQYSQWRYCQ